jgi:hypothetical protein
LEHKLTSSFSAPQLRALVKLAVEQATAVVKLATANKAKLTRTVVKTRFFMMASFRGYSIVSYYTPVDQ